MNNLQNAFYNILPIFLQNVACNIHGFKQKKLRYGGSFRDRLEWLEGTQWWTVNQIEEYQNQQLKKIIAHAYHTVPYYKRVFDNIRLKPNDIKTKEDLSKIPVLTKEDIRRNLADIISRDFKKFALIHSHTSGTSGKSLQFYMEPEAVQFRWAVWWRHKKRFRIAFDAPYATFTGLNAIPLNQKYPPFWRENKQMNQTVFTMHHIVPNKIQAIATRLNKGGFTYYAGYPSIIYVLARLLLEHGLKITRPPKVIFTGAENLYEHHRKVIAEVFQCVVTDQYGFSEGCGNASRCQHDVFHEDFEYGILECNNSVVHSDRSKEGRILATGFSSYAMPFIRYEVGDVGIWKPEASCSCGRHSRVLSKINGRVEDYVITPEGSRIMRFDYIFKDSHAVEEAQVVQYEKDSITVRVVRRPEYCQNDEELLRSEIKNKVSSKLKVNFEYIQEIEREANEKFRAVKSYLKEEQKIS
ncbi:MAG: phenylacetate--CoA ligase family protein [Candidatus Electrothrix sp. AU1_5]|nr:phenylacetate--CoA ligase family protein [Candidatus Electrothrix gigas]